MSWFTRNGNGPVFSYSLEQQPAGVPEGRLKAPQAGGFSCPSGTDRFVVRFPVLKYGAKIKGPSGASMAQIQ